MKQLKRISLIAILLALVVGWTTQQVAFGEEAGMNNNVGVGFDNDYEPTSSSDPTPVPVPDPKPDPKPVPTPKPKAISKVLPQTGEAVGSSAISWVGLAMIVLVISRFRQKKE